MILLLLLFSCDKEKPSLKRETWVFVMAGQSNMAGGGTVEPQDTATNERIFTININREIVLAKEPIHFYNSHTGLDCGMSFATHMLEHIDYNVDILMVPTALGATSIKHWVNNELKGNIQVFSNFEEMVSIAKDYGEIKAVLWMQGEADSNENGTQYYASYLDSLVLKFRQTCENNTLPMLIAELPSYLPNNYCPTLNDYMKNLARKDSNITTIYTHDLTHRGDDIHLDSKSQRELGKRFASAYMEFTNAE